MAGVLVRRISTKSTCRRPAGEPTPKQSIFYPPEYEHVPFLYRPKSENIFSLRPTKMQLSFIFIFCLDHITKAYEQEIIRFTEQK